MNDLEDFIALVVFIMGTVWGACLVGHFGPDLLNSKGNIVWYTIPWLFSCLILGLTIGGLGGVFVMWVNEKIKEWRT